MSTTSSDLDVVDRELISINCSRLLHSNQQGFLYGTLEADLLAEVGDNRNEERDDLDDLEHNILKMPETEQESQQVVDELDELEQQILNANEEDRFSISSSEDEITMLEREILNASETQDASLVHRYRQFRAKNASKAISSSLEANNSRGTEASTIPISMDSSFFNSPATTGSALRRTIDSVTNESQRSDDMFENMEGDNPEYLAQLSQERKRPKRTLPPFSSQGITFNDRQYNTQISASSDVYGRQPSPTILHNSQVSNRMTDAQADAVRLTEQDFDGATSEATMERNVIASEHGRPMLSNIRQLPTVSLIVGPPDSADEYEWSDSGLTPPTSPEGNLFITIYHVGITCKQPTRSHFHFKGEPNDLNLAPVALSDTSNPPRFISVKQENNLITAPPAHRTAPVPTRSAPRKIRTLWTGPEIDALEDGLEREGWGRWAAIKAMHSELLKDRGSVALKDKARTEATRRHRENIPLGPYCGCPSFN
ncbi:hypothetical protein INT43_006803 [Umbelopsis isabellina]|uniref:Myb-like domain-containing protein n=1 Tax=Mortierella isabellina TaxID=91625 RepID=A0A8H7Q0F0_MORIS|nr:hypothetical protein INT43_006803 [Umbelopsis isabellina]